MSIEYEPMFYLIGPYHATADKTTEQHIASARLALRTCLLYGLHAICPHMAFASMEQELPIIKDSFWYDVTMSIARRCDAGIVFAEEYRSSVGSMAEINHFRGVRKPIFKTFATGILPVMAFRAHFIHHIEREMSWLQLQQSQSSQ